MPEMVLLWTDILIFLLVGVVTAFILYARKKPHLNRPWMIVFSSKIGLSSLIVLLFYIAVGLLDSVHYKPDTSNDNNDSAEMLSLLDYMLTDLRQRQEKTYSAPLATHLYAKESIELEDGSTIRDYPRLVYAGTHLEDPEKDWAMDITVKVLQGVFSVLSAGCYCRPYWFLTWRENINWLW